jgi:hypothetical protein
MGNMAEDIVANAEWISTALSSSGYIADFSPESLWELDRFFDEQSKDGMALPKGLLEEDLGMRMFCIGAYLGEVLRRRLGGEWEWDENDPQAEINVSLRCNNGAVCWPIQRVMKRLANGPEDGIAVYGYGMGLEVGLNPDIASPPEKPAKKPWWKFWQ